MRDASGQPTTFLLLEGKEDESLKGLCDHWTEAQKGVN